MKTYNYIYKTLTAKIENHNGVWVLKMNNTEKVMVIGNETFPTKRAALNYAKTIFKQY
jgi:hypothetical protein